MARKPPPLPRGAAAAAATPTTMTGPSHSYQHSHRQDSADWRSQQNDANQCGPPERNGRRGQVSEHSSSQTRIPPQPRKQSQTSKSEDSNSASSSSSRLKSNGAVRHSHRDNWRDRSWRLPPSATENQWRPEYQYGQPHQQSAFLNYRNQSNLSLDREVNSHLSRKIELDMHISFPIGRTSLPSPAWPTPRPGIESLLRHPSSIPSPRPFTTYHRPSASRDYLMQCFSEPTPLPSPRPLLVILDLNGTLVHRKKKTNKATCRPKLHLFIDSLLDSHRAMVWTSTMPGNTMTLVTSVFPNAILNRLVDVWARDKLRLKQWEYNNKVQVYKNLEWVWDDENVKSHGKWDQSNTVLVDDSRVKAASHPFNLLEIPEFDGRPVGYFDEGKALLTVLRQLRVLSWYDNVSAKIREWDELRQEKLPLTEQEEEYEDLDDLEREARDKELSPEEREDEENKRISRRYDLEEFWDALLDKEEEILQLEKIVLTQQPPLTQNHQQQQQQEQQQEQQPKPKKAPTRKMKREAAKQAAKREKAQIKRTERKAARAAAKQ